MGWDDDHLHRFRIPRPGLRRALRPGGPGFGADAAAVPLSWISWFHATRSDPYMMRHFTAGYSDRSSRRESEARRRPRRCPSHPRLHCRPRAAWSSGRLRRPRDYAERRRGAVGPEMAGRYGHCRRCPTPSRRWQKPPPPWPILRHSQTSNMRCPACGCREPFLQPKRSRAHRSMSHCSRHSPRRGVPHDSDGGYRLSSSTTRAIGRRRMRASGSAAKCCARRPSACPRAEAKEITGGIQQALVGVQVAEWQADQCVPASIVAVGAR